MLNVYQILIYAVMMASITFLLAEYDGPFNILRDFRKKTKLPTCAPCASVWVAGFFFIFTLGNLNIVPAWAVAFLITRKF